jgi:hypothetical protein
MYMKNRFFKKTLVIAILLLITTISVASAYATSYENNATVTMDEPDNYLGEIRFIHTSIIQRLKWVNQRQMFHKPAITDFYFPEVNGSILVNFTLIIRQRLTLEKQADNNRFSRWSAYAGIPDDDDIIIEVSETRCTSIDWEIITVNLTARKPIETNGESKDLNVYLYGGVSVNGIPGLYWGFYPWMGPKPIRDIILFILGISDCTFSITVHPQ